MNSTVYISVIVPVYKVEKYIHRCIDSILAQTFTDFELILVDDGSPDNCGKICDEYAEKDNRIHVIHKENGGLSDARNAGIDWAFENSNSEWITFIDSDDWIHPKYLEALYNAVQQTGCSISVCGFERTEGEEPVVDDNALTPSLYNSEELYCVKNVNAIVAWGKLYKKEDFANIRYPVGKIHEDEFTTYKILFKYENVAFVDQPLYSYYNNPNGIIKSKWTPQQLYEIEALNYQMGFFKKNNYFLAYNTCIVNRIEIICKQLNDIKLLNNKNSQKKYIHILVKELRKTLKKGKTIEQLKFDKSGKIYIYEYAYPLEMKFYWYWEAIKRKNRKR